jgi:hypothetical protein
VLNERALTAPLCGAWCGAQFGRFMRLHKRLSGKRRDAGAAAGVPAAPLVAAGGAVAHVQRWKPAFTPVYNDVDAREAEAVALISEMRRAEAASVRMRDEARQLEVQLKSKSAVTKLPSITATKSAPELGRVRTQQPKRGRNKTRPPPLPVLKAYGMAAPAAVARAPRATAAAPAAAVTTLSDDEVA